MQTLGYADIINKDDLWTGERKLGHIDFWICVFCIFEFLIREKSSLNYFKYAEWSKSEREKQMSYVNTYIWNLETWYCWTYLQGSSGEGDIENRLVGTVEAEGGKNGESSIEA